MPKNPDDKKLHVAIIMDGNGRWATERGKPRSYGHLKGAIRAKEIIAHAAAVGINVLTLWGYSTDNNSRPLNERNALMKIFQKFIVRETDSLAQMNAHVTFIGDKTGLPLHLQRVMQLLENATVQNTGLHLQIALNYGGRDELLRAVNKAVALGEEVDEESFEKHLDTRGVCDPDFVIRTSGEMRLSGFMPWQSKHSELMFVDKHWPDFTPDDLDVALAKFKNRSRTFGGFQTKVI